MKSKKFIAAITLCAMLFSTVPVSAATAVINPSGASTIVSQDHYKVQSGDSLYTISKKFSTTVTTLVKINSIQNANNILVGQDLLIKEIPTINYVVQPGDNLWTLAKKYNTTVDTIINSNFLAVDYVMPRQTLTIPLNTTEVVKPVGVTMMKARVNNNYGDIYTWDNAMRIWSTGTKGTLKDLATGKTFNIKYYGGSNHSDIVPLTQADTNIMKSLYVDWSWIKKRPMVLYFTKDNVKYQMAVSLIGMPHSTTDIADNGMNGHCCMYFYNSGGHANPNIDPVAQANVLKANGQ
ncbi:MAG: LysM peptidoglycan-binding domain-containing protein [Bacillota bacterium]|nr:LysM peptidoglycan-binding domain-containing protein [Bacillota bacterium]